MGLRSSALGWFSLFWLEKRWLARWLGHLEGMTIPVCTLSAEKQRDSPSETAPARSL